MTFLNERVIREMERLLMRPLRPEEVRLLLLAKVVKDEIREREAATALAN